MLERLAPELLAVTEAAALAAAAGSGRGEPKKADRGAVDAMRGELSSVGMAGVVVIGEGEKDDAPMLFNGEEVGTGRGPEVDLAVDPLEGTKLLADAAPNSIAVIAAARGGSMWSPGPCFYMDKLAVSGAAAGVIDIAASPADNLAAIAGALDKPVRELGVLVLDKPRHEGLIEEIRAAGARVQPVSDGDVTGAILAALPNTSIDVLMGIGGTPEGLIAACALKALGGEMQCRVAPQKDDERQKVAAAGLDPAHVMTLDDLVDGDDTLFVATGITGGELLEGIGAGVGYTTTQSLVVGTGTGKPRFVKTIHAPEEAPAP